jgi:hypothetical protein
MNRPVFVAAPAPSSAPLSPASGRSKPSNSDCSREGRLRWRP